MKKIAALLALAFGLTVTAQAGTFQADPSHARIGFKVPHLVISKVSGEFTEYDATITLNDGGEIQSVRATIQAKSVDTGNEERDNHLRNADFLDVEKYPTITFESTGLDVQGGKKLLKGQLALHGVTKEIALPYELRGPVNDPWGNTKLGFATRLVIDRTEWGLTWSKTLETGGLLVGTDVEIDIDLEFTKVSEAAAGMTQEDKVLEEAR